MFLCPEDNNGVAVTEHITPKGAVQRVSADYRKHPPIVKLQAKENNREKQYGTSGPYDLGIYKSLEAEMAGSVVLAFTGPLKEQVCPFPEKKKAYMAAVKANLRKFRAAE